MEIEGPMKETNRRTLDMLRKKTDRQLLDLVRREAERSWQLAMRGLPDEAQALSAKAANLLAVARAPEQTRAEIEAQLEGVREAIGRNRHGYLAYRSASC
jgi:hypothetical protein